MRRTRAGIGLILGVMLAAVNAAAATAQDEPKRVAFFAASSQNGFNQAVWEGVKTAADGLGIESEVFDGEFNAEVQLAQVEDAVASGRFDGFVILANDTVGIGSAAGATLHINGFIIHSQLDEAMLQQISLLTDGAYYSAENEQDLRTIYDNLDPQLVMKPEKMEVTSIFAGAGILVLLIGGAFSLLWFSRLP